MVRKMPPKRGSDSITAAATSPPTTNTGRNSTVNSTVFPSDDWNPLSVESWT